MAGAKDITVKVIPASIAKDFIRKNHYSGKVVSNSILHFGCFLGGVLHGAMSYGSPLDKSKVLNLVSDTKWNEMLELNRMAFDDKLPKNSESRCLAVSFRLIKRHAPHIKWILSFSDGTASGDGTIYRASGFSLTQIRRNTGLYVFPDGERISHMTLTKGGDPVGRAKVAKKYGAILTNNASMKPFIDIGAKPAEGFQLRYIKVLNPNCKIQCPILPFSQIDDMGAGMLRGIKVTRKERMGDIV